MPHFWLNYGDASRLVGVIIMDAPSMIEARRNAAVRGIDAGAPFAEGHQLQRQPDGVGAANADRRMLFKG